MSDIEFIARILDKSDWLFYGEFECYLTEFLQKVFTKDLKEYGFDESLPNDFQVAYWSILSELVKLNLADYGTSPRGAWLTEDGERFKSIIVGTESAIHEAERGLSDGYYYFGE
jgi:hypothetical protein